MADTCDWPYSKTQTHQFKVYNLDGTNWADVGGLYIFAKLDKNGWWPIYIGQTLSFKTRLTEDHEHWNDAIREGATHIHACSVGKQAERDRLEKALIAHLQPPVNVQDK